MIKTRLEELNNLIDDILNKLDADGLTTKQRLLIEDRVKYEIERAEILKN